MYKIAFQIGSYPVTWYGVLVATAFIVGLFLAGRRARREGITSEQVMDLGPWMILGTIIGARILYVVTYWNEGFAGRPWTEIFMVQNGGLVYYGGFIGAALAVIIYLRKRHLPLWKFADVLAPSIPVGYAIGRIGCLMNGCCYGKACDLPWAIHFPRSHETKGVGVHPTQIYDSLLSLAFYAVLAWLYRRKKFDGQVFAAYLIGYAVLRSFVEMFRGDYDAEHIHGFFTPAQLVSLGILATGIVLCLVLPRRRESVAAAAR